MAKKQTPTPDTNVVKKDKQATPEKVNKKSFSKSTMKVSFRWSKGDKSGTIEVMSENVAEIMEYKGLGKKEK